jgi:hypothetical protein
LCSANPVPESEVRFRRLPECERSDLGVGHKGTLELRECQCAVYRGKAAIFDIVEPTMAASGFCLTALKAFRSARGVLPGFPVAFEKPIHLTR